MDKSPDSNPNYASASPGAAAPGVRFNGIVGRARTSLNTPVPYARLLLRNLTTGYVEARAVADQHGHFTFLDIGASGYIIELIGLDGSVIASSEPVALDKNEMAQATVRVAAPSTVQGLYGDVVAPTAADPVRTAVESGVDRVTRPEVTVSG